MVTALLLMLSAAQVPPGFVEARASVPQTQRQRLQSRPAGAVQAAARTSPRGRLDIDLSGLSDDDAVLASSSDALPGPGRRLDPFVADLISNVTSDPAPAAPARRQAPRRTEDPGAAGVW